MDNLLQTQKLTDCFICDAAKGNYWKVEDIPLFNRDGKLIFPATGSFSKDHCIVSPVEHVRSFANLSQVQLVGYLDLFNAMKKTTHKKYGDNLTIYETGMSDHEETGRNAIVHAHKQIFPNTDPEAAIHQVEKTLGNKLGKLDYVNDLHKLKNQRYLGILIDNQLHYHTGGFSRRFFRNELCKMHGMPSYKADYVEAPNLQATRETIKDFKAKALERELIKQERFLTR